MKDVAYKADRLTVWGCKSHNLVWPKNYNYCPYCGSKCQVFLQEEKKPRSRGRVEGR